MIETRLKHGLFHLKETVGVIKHWYMLQEQVKIPVYSVRFNSQIDQQMYIF